MANTGDDIEAKAGRWSFGGDVAKSFDNHIKKSVPGYEEGHDLISKFRLSRKLRVNEKGVFGPIRKNQIHFLRGKQLQVRIIPPSPSNL